MSDAVLTSFGVLAEAADAAGAVRTYTWAPVRVTVVDTEFTEAVAEATDMQMRACIGIYTSLWRHSTLRFHLILPRH